MFLFFVCVFFSFFFAIKLAALVAFYKIKKYFIRVKLIRRTHRALFVLPFWIGFDIFFLFWRIWWGVDEETLILIFVDTFGKANSITQIYPTVSQLTAFPPGKELHPHQQEKIKKSCIINVCILTNAFVYYQNYFNENTIQSRTGGMISLKLSLWIFFYFWLKH